MSFGILKPARQFISKPFGGGFHIDWSNPLCKQLLVAIPLGSAGNREFEYVERIYSNVITGTDCPVVTNGARYWSDNNTSIATNMVRVNPRASWVSLGTGPYTILARVFSIKPGPIFSLNNYNPNWFLSGAGEGPPANSLMIYDGGYGSYSSATVPLNKWAKIGWIRNSVAINDGFFYIDGNEAGVLSHDDTISSATSIQIGKNQPAADYHHHYGYIDFVFLWKRALSLHEINAFFNNPNQIFSSKGNSTFIVKAPFGGYTLSGSLQSQPATIAGDIGIICSLSGNVQSQQASLSGVIDTDANNISASLQAQSASLDANINVAIGLSCSLQAQVASLDSSIQVKLLLFGLLQSQQATMAKHYGTVRSSTSQSLSLSLKIGF